MSITLAIAPSGRLVLHHDSDEQSAASTLPQNLKAFETAFKQDACAGLLWLANEGHALDLRESCSFTRASSVKFMHLTDSTIRVLVSL